jgi:tRNA uridine 5-carbamoylmethylation protein Kti12
LIPENKKIKALNMRGFMSNFIIIIGPPAVGKMTVGQELAKRTEFKLFHNHLIIDALLPVFDFDTPAFQILVREFRTRVFEEAIESKLAGLIFTFVATFNQESCIKRLFEWINLWKDNGASVYVVELQATLDERLKRNETENRLHHKPAKRDIKHSRQILLKNEEEWTMDSPEGLFKSFPHLKLDSTSMTAEEVADRIMKTFNQFTEKSPCN